MCVFLEFKLFVARFYLQTIPSITILVAIPFRRNFYSNPDPKKSIHKLKRFPTKKTPQNTRNSLVLQPNKIVIDLLYVFDYFF